MPTLTIIEQLAADHADHEHRVIDKRRMPAHARYRTSDLHRAFSALTDVAYEGRWSRDDLIQLVDLALAEAAAAEKAADLS